MDRTFNIGLGIILVVGKRELDGVTRSLKKMGERYHLIGEVKRGVRGVTFV
jgi:phosphoribosylformylglycinamidine cyclo-ligase